MQNQALTNTSPSIDEAYAYCAHLTKAHYENFPVGSLLIPKSLRPHVQAIYAFARTADDFADEPGLSKEERLTQLNLWQDHLNTCEHHPHGPIFTALAQTIKTQHLPIQLLNDLLTAFRMDVATNRHNTLNDLLHYCTFSANPVGRLILHLFDYRSSELVQYSDAICTGLQLANFWQDIAIDFSRDRIYLPKEDMQRFNVTEADLQKGQVTANFKNLLDHLIAHTTQSFQAGYPLLRQVHGRLKYELRLTWLGGMHILHKISENNYDIFQNRPKLRKSDFPHLLIQALWPLKWHKK